MQLSKRLPIFLKIEFGYLKGKSDINPQWRLMAMTQAFGPVGHGWTYRHVRLWSETAPDGTIMAFAEVAVKPRLMVFGVRNFSATAVQQLLKFKRQISSD